MAHETQIRVLIADGQPLSREALARAIRQDPRFRLVGDTGDEREAVSAIRRLVPDVAVVDADLDALRLISAVAQQRPRTLVALLGTVRPDVAYESVAAGARGYLSRRASSHALCEAIRRIAAGEGALCDEAQTVVVSEIHLRSEHSRRLLTGREYDVLKLMADGLSNPEIGRALHLAPTTVKTYVGRVCDRLGARNRFIAVVEAARRGLLD